MSNENNIIFFDGDCNFCNSSVNFIIKHDHKAFFKFAPLKGEFGKRHIELANFNEIPDSLILLQDGHYYMQSEAIIRIVKELRGFWPFFYYLGIIAPKFILNFIYSFISKIRHKLQKNRPNCRVYSVSEKNRFFD